MSAPSLRQTVEDYLAGRAVRHSPSTVTNEAFVLRRFAATVAVGRDIQIRNLTAEHVEAWFAAVLRPHRDRNGVDRPPIHASTHHFYRTRVASLQRWAVQRGLTRADWLAHVPPMRLTQKVRQQPDPAHLWAMLDSAVEPRDRAVLAVAMNTGPRARTISGFKVGDLDLERRAVARIYYDTLAADSGHDGAIRVVMTLLHHTNVSTTEHYLGVASERRARDLSLRGRPLVPRPPSKRATPVSVDG